MITFLYLIKKTNKTILLNKHIGSQHSLHDVTTACSTLKKLPITKKIWCV